MKNFLSNYGLYKPYVLIEDYENSNLHYSGVYEFIGETFDYYCENEKSIKTFEIDIDQSLREYFGSLRGDLIPPENFIEGNLDFTFKAIGKCKSCNKYHINMLLRVYSEKPISNILNNYSNINIEPQNNHHESYNKIKIEKVGVSPERVPNLDKVVRKYFDRETNNWYFKAINSLENNFGIGSFAYFRRIVEKELLSIIDDIKELPDSHKTEIDELLRLHNNNPKISTIYDNIFKYLPNSLKVLGDNPIKLLYNQTSGGLHSLTEEECMKRSKSILELLNFVIIRINEEKSTIKLLRETIKSLK